MVSNTAYSVTKYIDFCYGHRLLEQGGKCTHPHGHNARAEIVLRAEQLNGQDMVVDFDHIKAVVRHWIDETLDHRMVLHKTDPLIEKLDELGEPYLAIEQHPTAEVLAQLIFEHAATEGFPVVVVRLWETPDSVAAYGDEQQLTCEART